MGKLKDFRLLALKDIMPAIRKSARSDECWHSGLRRGSIPGTQEMYVVGESGVYFIITYKDRGSPFIEEGVGISVSNRLRASIHPLLDDHPDKISVFTLYGPSAIKAIRSGQAAPEEVGIALFETHQRDKGFFASVEDEYGEKARIAREEFARRVHFLGWNAGYG